MDSIEFYIVFMIYNLTLCGIITIYYLLRAKKPKVLRMQFLVRIFLISALTVFLLDSLPYLVVDIWEIPTFNIIFANIFLLLLCYSTIMFELAKLQANNKDKNEKK